MMVKITCHPARKSVNNKFKEFSKMEILLKYQWNQNCPEKRKIGTDEIKND